MYNATNHLTSVVMWDDWIHFGTGEEVKFDLVRQVIEDCLGEGEVLLIYGRTTSGQYKREKADQIIKPLLGRENFQLWTVVMDKVIKFAAMGVLSVGKRNLQRG